MNTPICDFVAEYSRRNMIRGHMPGHKGVPVLGMENMDITEIQGADSLYEADSIIRKSEENASALFGCPTFYSTEGSTQCIKAMVYLALQFAKRKGKKPLIAAGRNAHKAFVTAAALMDADVEWIFPKEINMVGNEHQGARCKFRIDTAGRIGQQQIFDAQLRHHTNRICGVFHSIPFIIMQTTLHAYHLLAAQHTEYQSAIVPRCCTGFPMG